MLERVSAALNTTPTTIPQTPHISKNPPKKKKAGEYLKIIKFVSAAFLINAQQKKQQNSELACYMQLPKRPIVR